MTFNDFFSEKAALYAAARPRYPDALFKFVASLTSTRDRVWDCGTGNGQSAIGLAQHFAAVEASDASAQQIANALPCPGVRYSVQPAEQTDFPSAFFDAVCVAQALHWFDFERFYSEAHRVLKPGGIFAAWSYDWFHVSAEFDACFEETVLRVIEPYWPPQNKLVWNAYRDVPFPFAPIAAPDLRMEMTWTFTQLLAYVQTWSATRRCQAARGNGFMEVAEAKLAVAWKHFAEARKVTMCLHLRVGRHVESCGNPSPTGNTDESQAVRRADSGR